jgi:DNA-binding NarL/FixJ family response regulator
MTSRPKTQVLLVSLPGIVAQATRAVIASLGDVILVGCATGALTATQMLPELQPDLLLIDATLPDEEVAALLQWARAHLPAVHCVVMTLTTRQREQALAWGAHAAIHRASFMSELEMEMSRLSWFSAQNGLQ